MNIMYKDRQMEKNKVVKESLLEKFTEDSDPIKDMGIGMRQVISKWMREIGEEDTDTKALQQASIVGNLDFVDYLIKHGKKTDINRVLSQASAMGQLDTVKYAIENGADIHYLNDTALLSACRGYLDVVKYLVENGANIHAKRNEPLRIACYFEQYKTVKYLVEQGANPKDNMALKYLRENNILRGDYDKILKYLEAEIEKRKNTAIRKSVVKENLYEKFEEDSDPIKDMGIGVRASIKGWKEKIKKLDDKISNELGLRYVERACKTWHPYIDDAVYYIGEPDYMNDPTTSLPDLFRVSGITKVLLSQLFRAMKINDNYLEISCFTNLIVDKNKVIINKEEYIENLLKTIGIYSFLGEKEVSKNTISYEIKPQYLKFFKEEELNEAFIEDSDPVKDMGIGIATKLKKFVTELYEENYNDSGNGKVPSLKRIILERDKIAFQLWRWITPSPGVIKQYLINKLNKASLLSIVDLHNIKIFYRFETFVDTVVIPLDIYVESLPHQYVVDKSNGLVTEKFAEDSDPIKDMGIGDMFNEGAIIRTKPGKCVGAANRWSNFVLGDCKNDIISKDNYPGIIINREITENGKIRLQVAFFISLDYIQDPKKIKKYMEGYDITVGEYDLATWIEYFKLVKKDI